MIVIADLGATNARFCVTKDCLTYSKKENYQINNFESIEDLCLTYLKDKGLKGINKAVLGAAAPILGDKVSFVNTNLEFSIKNLEKKIFSGGLIVVNDLELQAYALFNLKAGDLSFIGEKNLTEGPKILVSPGTGLGLAGILGDTVIATEAGHINIPNKELRPDLKLVIDRFTKENYRAPTYEDFLSGKGIIYFYETLSGKINLELRSEEILLERGEKYSLQTIDVFKYLLSSYLRYMALVWGSYGGVLLSGSIVNSLLLDEDYKEFRNTFEDSETMKDFMRTIPLAIVLIEEIGFVGGLELSKKLK
ncbi:glucokinase [SAR86 cluster bacterium]|nr:glucokinase [SAR86 cluster bacterium]